MPLFGSSLTRADRLDLKLFTKIAGMKSAPLDQTLPRMTRAADHSRLWMVIAGLMFVSRRRDLRRAALRGLLSLLGTSALVNGPLKWLWRRKRPSLDLVPEARRILKMPITSSFPSGHTASAFAFTAGVAVESRAAGAALLPVAGAVGFSRVYTGAHYPGDVLAGAAIGSATAISTRTLWPRPERGPAAAAPVPVDEASLPTETGDGLTVIINQASGRSVSTLAHRIGSLLPDAEVRELDPSDGSDLEVALKEAASRSRALGVCGGDGTVTAAAQAALEHDIPLLVIPGGTLDHFAQALGIESPRDAVAAVKKKRVVSADVGLIDGRPFLNTASLGGYADIVRTRERLETKIGKWPALVIAIVHVLRHSEPVEIMMDGQRKKVWLAFFGNCRYHSSGFAPTWRERLDDGWIDIRYVEARPRWPRSRLVASLVVGRLGRRELYRKRLVASLKITSEEGLRLARDGEVFDGSGSFEVTKRPRALKVLVS